MSSTNAGEAEQTADLFSEPTRSCTAEGEPEEENGPNERGGYCPGRNGQGKNIVLKYLSDQIHCNEKKIGIKLRNSNSDKSQ